ncbi:MAG: hypothetical protein N0E54_17305, partial [Candidatus Thiodiazotropha taylori]|nr:hypothetical protein [Candidatus Thiodiazotropha endolucinida]MCW4230501.1 hypothetical protein [Candidatus Thiodiazotropha taylori]
VEVPIHSGECKLQDEPQCEELISSLEVAINQYVKPYNHLSGKRLSELAGKLESEWGGYFEKSRPQTLLDSMFTTFMEQSYFSQNRLLGPMSRQWFAIHPSLVIENVGNAIDGDELAPALAIEWIGVNWWDKKTSAVGYPIGISLSSVYSDRSSAKDIGHGLMFHFDNSFSLGITNHDGETGFYVTVDVLNIFAKKKQRINHYKDEITGIRESVSIAISKIKH